MQETANAPILHADRHHAGARLASLGLWLAAVVIAYILLRAGAAAIFGDVAGLGALAVVVAAILVAQPVAWYGEKQIMARWLSGRSVRLTPGLLEWREKAHSQRFDLAQAVDYWRWRFVVVNRRAGRVPNGHHCLAIRLVQGDDAVSLYAFAPPAEAEALAERYPFFQLRRGLSPDARAADGRDAAYLAAETTRWDSGAELAPDDLESLLDHLAAHLPEFASASSSGA